MRSARYLVFVLLVGALACGWSSGATHAQAMTHKKRVIDTGEMQRLTNKAGVPISVAVADNTHVYVSALAPFDLDAKSMVTGSIEDQADQVLKNLDTVLKAAGSSLDKVVNVTVYVASSDKAAFESFNKVFSKYFPTEPPSRNWVPITGFPLGQDLEVAAIALL